MVRNVHQRRIRGSAAAVGALLDSLSTGHDRLWPRDEWPPMRLDGPLGVGASGGHGPVRYVVVAYQPGQLVRFRFTRPAGFHGHHAFVVSESSNDANVILRHELTMSVTGFARLTWPLFFRPLHDALIEESLDRAETQTGHPPEVPAKRSLWTRMLRSAAPLPTSSAVELTGHLVCAHEGEAATVRRYLPRHVELTHAESGCLRFDVKPTHDPLVWSVSEKFADRAAFDEHQARVAASEWGRATVGIRRDFVVSLSATTLGD